MAKDVTSQQKLTAYQAIIIDKKFSSPILETIASEAASLGFEVNWQKTKVQALGCREDMPLTIKVRARTSQLSRSLSTLALLSTHQPEALVTSVAEVPSLVLPCRA